MQVGTLSTTFKAIGGVTTTYCSNQHGYGHADYITENLKKTLEFVREVMELNVLEETPKKIVFELKGAGHTLCNALKTELWNNKHIKIATYVIGHPLIGIPTVTVETDGTVKPRKALVEAANKLAGKTDKFKKEIKKIRW